jgi:hypothetical protein
MMTALVRAAAWARRNVVELCVVLVCFIIGGLPGLVVGAAGQVGVHRRGPRVAAAAAVCALALAAVATAVAPWSGHGALFGFPKDHSVAAEAGRAAGILLLVALVGFVRAERTRAPEEAR